MLRLCFLRYDFKIVLKTFAGGGSGIFASIHNPGVLYASKNGFALCMLTESCAANPLVLLWLGSGTALWQRGGGLWGASPALIEKGSSSFPMWRGWERHWERGPFSAAADPSLWPPDFHLVLFCHDHPQVMKDISSFGESRGIRTAMPWQVQPM